MEIERKFLVSELPDLDEAEAVQIEQGYLAACGEDEVRLRRAAGQRRLTAKRGSGLRRDEAEAELAAGEFDSLWALTEGRRLRKRRYRMPYRGHEIELDVYEGGLEGLVVAEVEFASEDEARGFVPPPWVGGEVTGQGRFTNRCLAVEGPPG